MVCEEESRMTTTARWSACEDAESKREGNWRSKWSGKPDEVCKEKGSSMETG